MTVLSPVVCHASRSTSWPWHQWAMSAQASQSAAVTRRASTRRARRLENQSHDPAVTPAVMMRAVLEAFPTGDPTNPADPVVVLLDNLEAAMDPATETLTEPALTEALRAVLTAPAHAV